MLNILCGVEHIAKEIEFQHSTWLWSEIFCNHINVNILVSTIRIYRQSKQEDLSIITEQNVNSTIT